MPAITHKKIGIVLDMHGCPNRCRHCFLGFGNNRKMPDDDLRWIASQFRQYLENIYIGEKKLAVSTWFREPDFSDDYLRLYELEEELGDGKPERYELLSIWRLARDKNYAAWAKSVGHDTCQITFFGMEETTDWFYRRKGAFHDALTATERLLDMGIKPRWQLFFTKKLLPDIDEFMCLVERLRLPERVRELGREFQLFINTPSPDYEARKIENLRPTMEAAQALPTELLASSRQYLHKEKLWQSEGDLYTAIIEAGAILPHDEEILSEPAMFWFFITNNWDIFSNIGTLEPWWCLGNLKKDSVETIMRRFEHDEILGLDILYHYSPEKLADEYGDPKGRKIYSGKTDLLSLYHAKHCEKMLKF